jgi:hypothetical protein
VSTGTPVKTVTNCMLPEGGSNNGDFELALDAEAFKFHVMAGSKSFRLMRLDTNGSWHETDEDIFTKPYEDEHLRIVPEGLQAKVTVKRNVEILLKSAKFKPSLVLCSKGPASIPYVYLKLKRTPLKQGTITIGRSTEKNFFFLIDGTYILMITLPDDPTTVRPNGMDVTNRANLDVAMGFFATSVPMHNPHV